MLNKAKYLLNMSVLIPELAFGASLLSLTIHNNSPIFKPVQTFFIYLFSAEDDCAEAPSMILNISLDGLLPFPHFPNPVPKVLVSIFLIYISDSYRLHFVELLSKKKQKKKLRI